MPKTNPIIRPIMNGMISRVMIKLSSRLNKDLIITRSDSCHPRNATSLDMDPGRVPILIGNRASLYAHAT